MELLKFLKNKKLVLFLVIIVFVLLIINLLLKTSQKRLTILNVRPKETTSIKLNQSFQFLFNVTPQDLTIETTPFFTFQKSIQDNWLIIKPKEKLQLETNYTIIIKQNDKEVYKHFFTTRKALETEIAEEETKETLELYPLINYLPLDNNKYHLTYSAPLVLKVTIKSGSQEEIRKEVVNWITSKGVNPITHQIIFE